MEKENLKDAIKGISELKPFKQGWVLYKKGKGYFKRLNILYINPDILAKSPKDARHFESEEDALRFVSTKMDQKYQAVIRVIQ